MVVHERRERVDAEQIECVRQIVYKRLDKETRLNPFQINCADKDYGML